MYIVRQYMLWEIIGIGAIIYFIRKMLTMPETRLKIDQFMLRIPILGDLLLKTAIVNFSNSFNILLSNGVAIIDALEMCKESMGNRHLSNIIARVKEKVKGGSSVSMELEASRMFPPLVVQMIGVGEETGRLTNMLSKISEFYEKRVSAAVDTLASIFEPLILVFMGAIIGVLVIAMFLPIFKMSEIGSKGV